MKKRRSVLTITELGQLLEIPSEKKISEIIFLPIWICGWAIGEFLVLKALFGGLRDSETGEPMHWGIKVFLGTWLAGWTFGGISAIRGLFKILLGKEIIFISENQLEITEQVWKVKKQKNYDYAQIRDLRLAPEGITKGKILFDYGPETVEMCREIDYAEAKIVYQEMVEILGPNKNESNQSIVSIPFAPTSLTP